MLSTKLTQNISKWREIFLIKWPKVCSKGKHTYTVCQKPGHPCIRQHQDMNGEQEHVLGTQEWTLDK